MLNPSNRNESQFWPSDGSRLQLLGPDGPRGQKLDRGSNQSPLHYFAVQVRVRLNPFGYLQQSRNLWFWKGYYVVELVNERAVDYIALSVSLPINGEEGVNFADWRQPIHDG